MQELFRFNIYFLALGEQRGFLGEVNEVKFDFPNEVLIFYAEKEPLVMATRVRVNSHV